MRLGTSWIAAASDAVLRVSITDRCNLRCRYCLPPAGVPLIPRDELLSFEELAEIVAWLCRELRIRRVKLTGGEPLVRSGVVGLVRALAAVPEVIEVSMTTNGSRLGELARPLHDAGLARVNVSVDSLDPAWFSYLTRGGCLADTLSGIDAAIAAGLEPVKLNTVLLASRWRADVPALLDFAQRHGCEVRFIELMRTGTDVEWASREYVSADWVREELGLGNGAARGSFLGSGPALSAEVVWRGAPARVGWIMPRSRRFCDRCTRVRLDARGRVRRCLMDPEALELARMLRAFPEAMARQRLHEYLAGKVPSAEMDTVLPMISVGG